MLVADAADFSSAASRDYIGLLSLLLSLFFILAFFPPFLLDSCFVTSTPRNAAFILIWFCLLFPERFLCWWWRRRTGGGIRARLAKG